MRTIKLMFNLIIAIIIICATVLNTCATENYVDRQNEEITNNSNESVVYLSELVPKGDAGFLSKIYNTEIIAKNSVSRTTHQAGDILYTHHFTTTDGTDITAYELFDYSDDEKETVYYEEIVAKGFAELTVEDDPSYIYNDIAHAWYGSTEYWIDLLDLYDFKNDDHTL